MHRPLLRAERRAGAVVVVLNLLDGRVDRRRIEAAAAHQLDLGGKSSERDLVDIATWGALVVAEAWGGPWASWCPYPLPGSGPGSARAS